MLTLTLIFFFLIQHLRFFNISNVLQKQYYDVYRYILYKKEKTKQLIILFILFAIFCVCYFLNNNLLVLFPLLFIEKIKNKIVKFKITSRIKRQFCFFEVLDIFNFLFLLLPLKTNYSIIIFVYNVFCYWISFCISIFIEKIIQRKNIKRAKEKLKNYNITFIAITGSYGKTSCKNYIYELLKNDYNVLKTPKSYNTLNGILSTINNELKPYHKIFIAEFGVDKVKGMDKFIKHFSVDIGVISKIGCQHLKTFKTLENIKNEKMKLLINSKKFAIVNLDDENIDANLLKCKTISFSTHNNKANIYVINEKQEDLKTHLKIKIFDDIIDTYTLLLAKHNIENLMCSISVAKCLNIDNKTIIETVKKLKNVEHRLSLIDKGNWKILDDSYNSNFDGFINALDVLKKAKNTRVLITPGVIEKTNSKINDNIIAKKIKESTDLILLINKPSFSYLIDKKLEFNSFIESYNFLKCHFTNESLTILIENDIPDIYLK